MPIRMIASRTVYRPDEATEYKKGEAFTVESEKEADRLVRTRRAQKAQESKAATVAPRRGRPPNAERAQIATKVMTSDPAPVAKDDAPAESTGGSTPGRYFRSDMRAED